MLTTHQHTSTHHWRGADAMLLLLGNRCCYVAGELAAGTLAATDAGTLKEDGPLIAGPIFLFIFIFNSLQLELYLEL